MKSAVIALFLGATIAEPFGNEETPNSWKDRMPSSAGFLQVTACINSGASGVTCIPENQELYATGMNGDEDLGEDIIMKGEPYHYHQKQDTNLV